MYICNDKIHEIKIASCVCECGFPNVLGKQCWTKQRFSTGSKAQPEGQQQYTALWDQRSGWWYKIYPCNGIMPEFSEKCIQFQNSTSVLALDLVLPGAMKNNADLEDLRLYTFLYLLDEPGLFGWCQKRALGKGKNSARGQFWKSQKNHCLI